MSAGSGPDILPLLQAQAETFARDAARVQACALRWTHKKLRKRLWEFEVRYTVGDGAAPRRAAVIAKQYAQDRGGHAFRVMRWLSGQGFHPPAPFLVPEPFAYDPDLRLLLQEKAAGEELAAALGGDVRALEQGARLAARWLAALHRLRPAGFKRARASAVRSIHARQRELGKSYPELRPLLDDLAALVVERVRASGDQPVVPSHGDYHPKNIFVAGERVTVIDFDHFGLREPASDVGYFAGQMAIMAYFRCGGFDAALPAVSGFWETYAAEAVEPPWERVAVHVSRTFLQSLHYELCVLRNGRTDLVDAWLAQAEAWLRSGTPDEIGTLLRAPAQLRSEGARAARLR